MSYVPPRSPARASRTVYGTSSDDRRSESPRPIADASGGSSASAAAVRLAVTSTVEFLERRVLLSGEAIPPPTFMIGVWAQPIETMDRWKARGVNTLYGFEGHLINGSTRQYQDTIAKWSDAAVSKQLWMIREPPHTDPNHLVSPYNAAADVNQQYLLGWNQEDEPELYIHKDDPNNPTDGHNESVTINRLQGNYDSWRSAWQSTGTGQAPPRIYDNVSGDHVGDHSGDANSQAAVRMRLYRSAQGTANHPGPWADLFGEDYYPIANRGNPDQHVTLKYFPQAGQVVDIHPLKDNNGNVVLKPDGTAWSRGEGFMDYTLPGPRHTAGTDFARLRKAGDDPNTQAEEPHIGDKANFATIETSAQRLVWNWVNHDNNTATANIPQQDAAGEIYNSKRGPTVDEFRGELWDAVIHGANGIMYFPQRVHGGSYDSKDPANALTGFDDTPSDVALEMKAQDDVLTGLGSVLVSPHDPAGLSFQPAVPSSALPLQATWRSDANNDYFIVENMSHQPLSQAKFQLIGGKTSPAQLPYEPNHAPVRVESDGTVHDDFGPYGVHIYVLPHAVRPPVVSLVSATRTGANRHNAIVTFKGSASPGAAITIAVKRGGIAVLQPQSTVAQPTGAWTLAGVSIPKRDYTVRVTATLNGLSTTISYSAKNPMLVPVTAFGNAGPAIAAARSAGSAAAVGGVVNPARVAGGQVVLNGFARPFAAVAVARASDSAVIGTATADRYGQWQLDASSAAPAAGQTATFTATDDTGLASAPFTLAGASEVVAPTILDVSAGGRRLGNNFATDARSTWTFHGAAGPGQTVILYDADAYATAGAGAVIGQVVADAEGSWSYDYDASARADGSALDVVASGQPLPPDTVQGDTGYGGPPPDGSGDPGYGGTGYGGTGYGGTGYGSTGYGTTGYGTTGYGTTGYGGVGDFSADSPVFRVTLDTGAPALASATASLDDAGAGVGSLMLTFTEPVEGLRAEDLQLADGTTTSSLAGATLETADNVHWTLSGLGSLGINHTGTFTLTHTDPARLTNAAGTPVAGGFPAFRFFLFVGGPASETIRLAPAGGGAIGVYVNGAGTAAQVVPAGAADQILVTGGAGDDSLVDELPAGYRPSRGIAFSGGAGTNALSYASDGPDDTVTVGGGRLTVGANADSDADADTYDDTIKSISISTGYGNDTVDVTEDAVPVSVNTGVGNDTVTLHTENDAVAAGYGGYGGTGDLAPDGARVTVSGTGHDTFVYGPAANGGDIIVDQPSGAGNSVNFGNFGQGVITDTTADNTGVLTILVAELASP